MSTRITDTAMSSTSTDHTARRTQPTGQWRVSWLPHRLLTRNEAVTAMTIAEVIASRPAPGNRIWSAVTAWATELDLTTTEAQTLAINAFKQKADELAKGFGFAGYTLREVSVNASSGDPIRPRMIAAQAKSMASDSAGSRGLVDWPNRCGGAFAFLPLRFGRT